MVACSIACQRQAESGLLASRASRSRPYSSHVFPSTPGAACCRRSSRTKARSRRRRLWREGRRPNSSGRGRDGDLSPRGEQKIDAGTGRVHRSPRVINVDKNPSYPPVIGVLKSEGTLRRRCRLRPVQYLNNVLEQDHRAIKRRVRASQGFRSFWGAYRTIQGYEAGMRFGRGKPGG
jgi:hypothetical protein